MNTEPEDTIRGRYRLVRVISRSGIATVWEGFDPVLDRPVAVKVLHRAYTGSADDREALVTGFVQAARLTHPNIVATYEAGDDDGRVFVVTEFVRGNDVQRMLDQRHAFGTSEVAAITIQVAQALTYAHRAGATHGGITPANVLVQPDGHVKVTDFGRVRTEHDRDATSTGAGAGSARYLAPEQVADEAVTDQADVYALAIVAYEMLAHHLPFEGDSGLGTAFARVSAPPTPLHRFRRDVPPRFEAIIDRALARHPQDRPSAEQFATTLAPFRNEHTPPAGTPAVPARPVPPPPTPRRASRVSLVGLLVLIVLALVIAAVAVRVAVDTRAGRTGATTTVPSRVLTPVDVRDFDPEGDNGRENPARIGAATDGDPATTWTSETYTTPEFGGGKSGVGIVVDLGAPRRVTRVEVDGEPGWNGEVAVATDPVDQRAAFGAARAGITDAPANAVFTLDPAADGRYVLVWCTRLPPSGRLTVDEVRVFGD